MKISSDQDTYGKYSLSPHQAPPPLQHHQHPPPCSTYSQPMHAHVYAHIHMHAEVFGRAMHFKLSSCPHHLLPPAKKTVALLSAGQKAQAHSLAELQRAQAPPESEC
eukprot:1161772-Pelagomonas_calceolata.AAC.3